MRASTATLLAAAAAVSVTLPGCPETVQTTATFVPKPDLGACLGENDKRGSMNAYMVQVFSLTPELVAKQPKDACYQCVVSVARCALVAETCRCGADVPVTPQQLAQQVSGVRFGGLEVGGRFCLRVIAAELSPAAVAACSCPLELTPSSNPDAGAAPPDPGSPVRACAMSRETPTPSEGSITDELLFVCKDKVGMLPPSEGITSCLGFAL